MQWRTSGDSLWGYIGVIPAVLEILVDHGDSDPSLRGGPGEPLPAGDHRPLGLVEAGDDEDEVDEEAATAAISVTIDVAVACSSLVVDDFMSSFTLIWGHHPPLDSLPHLASGCVEYPDASIDRNIYKVARLLHCDCLPRDRLETTICEEFHLIVK